MNNLNPSNDFKTMSTNSNSIGIQLLKERITIIKEHEERNNYSANDYLIRLEDGRNIMVEFKVRNKLYDSLLIEESKINLLIEKKKNYITNGNRVDDIWYCVVVDKQIYIFSLKSIRSMIKSKLVVMVNEVYSQYQISEWFKENPGKLLRCKMICPNITAYGYTTTKVKKNLIIPIKYSI